MEVERCLKEKRLLIDKSCSCTVEKSCLTSRLRTEVSELRIMCHVCFLNSPEKNEFRNMMPVDTSSNKTKIPRQNKTRIKTENIQNTKNVHHLYFKVYKMN